MNTNAAQKIVNVVTVVGCYDRIGKSSVYVIPDEIDATQGEEMPYDRPDAVLVIEWVENELADRVATSLAAILSQLGMRVIETPLPDD